MRSVGIGGRPDELTECTSANMPAWRVGPLIMSPCALASEP